MSVNTDGAQPIVRRRANVHATVEEPVRCMFNVTVVTTAVALLVACSETPAALPAGPDPLPRTGVVQTASLRAHEAAGAIGGGVLTPGETFPPTRLSVAVLERQEECLDYAMTTTGLPPGAYTNWWLIFNRPEECRDAPFGIPCGANDAVADTSVAASVFWATGGVVEVGGVGTFAGRTCIGGDLGTPASQHFFGPGLLDPQGAVVKLVVKYHGPPSDSSKGLFSQTHTALGGCLSGANAIIGRDGVRCFDAQIVGFDAPVGGP